MLDIQWPFPIWKLKIFISGTFSWGPVFSLGWSSWCWTLSVNPKFHHVFSTTFCFVFLLYSLWEFLNLTFQTYFIFNFWCLCLIPKYSFLFIVLSSSNSYFINKLSSLISLRFFSLYISTSLNSLYVQRLFTCLLPLESISSMPGAPWLLAHIEELTSTVQWARLTGNRDQCRLAGQGWHLIFIFS